MTRRRATMNLVTNIQKYSIHDGDGIRTTVFFKGCPLKCEWCHNPETQRFERELQCDKEKCVGCGTCAKVCPNGAITMVDGKPALDTRYSEEDVVSHDQNSIRSTPIESSGSILLLASDIDVVGIDEAQFLDNGLVEVCNELANRGVRVIVAGLDMDFKGVPFGPIPALCAIADEVTKVHAICVKCGSVAYVSHRLVNNDKRVLLGEKDEYEPLCRECYQKAILNEKL